MIRPDVLQRAKERLELLASEDPRLAAARAPEIVAQLTPQEQVLLARWVDEWLEARAADELARAPGPFAWLYRWFNRLRDKWSRDPE